MPTSLDVIQESLPARGQGPHPAVVGPVRTAEWLDAIAGTVREKGAVEARAGQSR
jgi:hypothetical protein